MTLALMRSAGTGSRTRLRRVRRPGLGARQHLRRPLLGGGERAGLRLCLLGAGLGLLLGGVIVQSISWRWVFLVNVPVAATVAPLALRRIPATARERGHIDVVGAITATASLGALIFGLSRAAEHGWGNGLTAGPIAAGLLGLVTFVTIERRSAHPLTPL